MANSITELNNGEVVKSTQGGDSGKAYIVVGIDHRGYAKLIDGKRHVIGKPKTKNLKHIVSIGVSVEMPSTNEGVVTALRRAVK